MVVNNPVTYYALLACALVTESILSYRSYRGKISVRSYLVGMAGSVIVVFYALSRLSALGVVESFVQMYGILFVVIAVSIAVSLFIVKTGKPYAGP